MTNSEARKRMQAVSGPEMARGVDGSAGVAPTPARASTGPQTANPAMTERQAKAWPEAIERLRAHYSPIPMDPRSWDIAFSEETRPGRGHAINATYLDGEVFAQVLMDVYGYPNVSIAYLDWTHADSNEECDCEPCVSEREQEDGDV